MKPEFRQLRLSQLDRNLELARSLPPRPSGGWIASVREALGLSQRQAATWSTYLYRSLARSRNWRNNPLASEPRVM